MRASIWLLLAAAVPVAAADATLMPEDFAYGMEIRTAGNAAAYRVTLPAEVYRDTVRADLGDLRVFNASGHVVPYALQSPRTEAAVKRPARTLPFFPLRGEPRAALDAVRVTIESGKAAVDVQSQNSGSEDAGIAAYLVDGRALDLPVWRFDLAWPDDAAEFAGRLNVEAGDDLGTFRIVARDVPVANLRANNERLVERRIELPATRARFWRLSWSGTPAPFALTGVLAEPADDRLDVERTRLVVNGKALGSERGAFEFDLGARLPVDRVNVELPEQNTIVQIELLSRSNASETWRSVVRQGFYRLRSGDAELRNAPVPITSRMDRYWLARVDQAGGGLGIGVPSLAVGWVPGEIVFLARGAGPYLLAYGSGNAPRSEVALNSIPANIAIVPATLASARALGGAARLAPPKPLLPWKSALLWAVLAVGAAFLMWMAYRLSRQLK